MKVSRGRPSHAGSLPKSCPRIGSSPCHDRPVPLRWPSRREMAHMTPYSWRFGIALAFLGFASILPATAEAQCPVYLTQWGTEGSGDCQFSGPYGVATDAAGNVYVADRGNHRIQKFTGTGVY